MIFFFLSWPRRILSAEHDIHIVHRYRPHPYFWNSHPGPCLWQAMSYICCCNTLCYRFGYKMHPQRLEYEKFIPHMEPPIIERIVIFLAKSVDLSTGGFTCVHGFSCKYWKLLEKVPGWRMQVTVACFLESLCVCNGSPASLCHTLCFLNPVRWETF